MFDEHSRYVGLPTAELTLPDGRRVRYVTRRVLPSAATIPAVGEVVTTGGDRLDRLAASAFDDPVQYWRICDANDAVDPAELLATVGRRLRLPHPDPYA
ncbi:hypothetical protein [Micromonospora endophytica]|uniref:Uncharacterized protein n=1 Tax=Micromonospora endophytica TaxID=515350 RepID=A0A2W2CF76_9ACTN|nr:hypothetical protein [Micromonospora endophytica]PZF98021.1 hypothetical protein C1I93_10010 [Micromonospora endophytica]RIW49852.1 hypothetical protein D3H59_03580 [Micromonospora endophytica]BCJ57214.1 hypothetical protein Jiend_06360 [Micromonospora endophytica]